MIPLESFKLLMRLIYNIFDSPFGKTGIAITPYGVCRVILSITEESEFVETLKTIYHSPKKEPRQLKVIEKEFHLYFSGKLKKFSFKVDLRKGTYFQQRVWQKLTLIPFGETRSYQWLATEIFGKNPVPLIIPCHRVIQKNGTLGGFTGGTHLKRYLINLEKETCANFS